MIEKLVLKNFESHVDTVIDFSNGIHVLTGSSNAGKSSILRALRLVMLNEPSSDKYINFKADECSVTLYVNGHIIERVRAKNNKKNLYVVDGKELKAFGKGVPQEVTDIVNMNDLNFEWQFDSKPFLLSETGGYISQRINDIMNLSLIDSSQKAVDSLKRSVKKDIESEKKNGEELKDEIDALSYIYEVEPILDEIVKEQNYIDASKKKKSSADDMVKDIGMCEKEMNEIETISPEAIEKLIKESKDFYEDSIKQASIEDHLQMLDFTKRMLEYIKVVNPELLEQEIANLQGKESESKGIKMLCKNYDSALSEAEKIELIRERSFMKSEEDLERLTEDMEKLGYAREVLSNFEDIQKNIQNINDEISALRKEYAEIAPDVCPICGGKMKKELE